MSRSDGLLLPSSLVTSILNHFKNFFNRLKQGEAAASVHRSSLIAHSGQWAKIKSNNTCFSCLMETPHHKLCCGHWICENCVQTFGESKAEDPYLFSLKHCLLDGEIIDLIVRVRPPTAGHSILCIDGGGIRGIIPPAILNQVQKRLGVPIPIQEFFTLAYGVSAGALIVLAMFANGWSVEQCTAEFQKLAELAFRPSSAWSFPGGSWIRSCVADALYSEFGIETALKRAFGETALTETSYARSIGAKIGIPAATIYQPYLCLFTNYSGSEKERPGYKLLPDAENVKIWEV
ncbi:hypothetical protein SNK05_013429 [Fusarium graminearum]